jgi:hypothetical protein
MTATELTGADEKARAEKLVAALPGIPEVASVTVRLDDDWSGDPSLYLTFRLRGGVQVDDAFIKRFLDYSTRVQSEIFRSGISRFPYARMELAA